MWNNEPGKLVQHLRRTRCRGRSRGGLTEGGLIACGSDSFPMDAPQFAGRKVRQDECERDGTKLALIDPICKDGHRDR